MPPVSVHGWEGPVAFPIMDTVGRNNKCQGILHHPPAPTDSVFGDYLSSIHVHVGVGLHKPGVQSKGWDEAGMKYGRSGPSGSMGEASVNPMLSSSIFSFS